MCQFELVVGCPRTKRVYDTDLRYREVYDTDLRYREVVHDRNAAWALHCTYQHLQLLRGYRCASLARIFGTPLFMQFKTTAVTAQGKCTACPEYLIIIYAPKHTPQCCLA